MERRRNDRSTVSINAAFRPRGGVKFPAAVTDLTLQGGCIDSGFLFEKGSDGWLQLPTLSDWHARIVWRSGWRAGIAFSTPYNGAVLETVLVRAGLSAAPRCHLQHPIHAASVSQARGSRRGQILSGLAVPPAPRIARDRQAAGEGDTRHYRIGETAELFMRGTSVKAMVINISKDGLTVRTDMRPYIGEPVALDVAYGDPIEGSVSWWQDGCFGIQLAQPNAEIAA